MKTRFPRVAAIGMTAALLATPLAAETSWPQQGWEVHPTAMSYTTLLDELKAAVRAEGMFVVTEAGPTEAAANRGVTIPGNRVVGVFRNDYAVEILRLSVPAMIEAPMRFYVTEEADGSATLSWKAPSHVLAPYVEEGGEGLVEIGEELDAIFSTIASRVTEESR
ncbi:Uncharacterized conserved protein, DUF302 family [Halomonas shengliensis]|uniref:Uncharacterized conserved protein, DUF302 family n=1 Tax=Halomonas shengliensis TaxID=419597 RepID=A0A1H0D314_9GAMM|nr:DUF302 domain-containing protein [Halomonas shengliensis]SDN64535.1 Uncharacterized conserved protein, DUF302 family [Halomonas shengliensis]